MIAARCHYLLRAGTLLSNAFKVAHRHGIRGMDQSVKARQVENELRNLKKFKEGCTKVGLELLTNLVRSTKWKVWGIFSSQSTLLSLIEFLQLLFLLVFIYFVNVGAWKLGG